MRKIIFEQTGNIILTIVLTLAMAKTILESKYSTEPGNLFFEVKFGILWIVFLIAGLLFSIAKYYYSKNNSSIEGYKKEDGEFSAYDEREIKISFKSTKMVYRVIIYVLLLMMIILMYSNLFVQSREYLQIIGVVILGISLISVFLTYMFSWIFYDSKL